MELLPKLLAAADMCEAGEEVNLDELAFLLRYASDELQANPEAVLQRDRLAGKLKEKVLAYCDLLGIGEHKKREAGKAKLEELEQLAEELESKVREKYHMETAGFENETNISFDPEMKHFQSGR